MDKYYHIIKKILATIEGLSQENISKFLKGELNVRNFYMVAQLFCRNFYWQGN